MIMSSKCAFGDIAARNTWSIHSMQHASILEEETTYLGGISSQGYARFAPDTLPPEMFAKLSQIELKSYKHYWDKVRDIFKVRIENGVIDPYIDLTTGATYVIKCHFIPLSSSPCLSDEVETSLSKLLPYELIPKGRSADFWSLGKLIFLLSTGQSLFPVDAISGRFDYLNLYNFRPEPSIHEHVRDPLAQAVLLMLLCPQPDREKIKLDSILSHPFFVGEHSSSVALVRQIVERRSVESAAIKRQQRRKLAEEFQQEWVTGRTRTINCWDFEVLEKIHMSPSEIIKGMWTRKDTTSLPCNYMLLPYRLSPAISLSESECLLAENIGKSLLELSKACFFISVMKQATSGPEETATLKWSSSEMLRVLDLSSDEFSDVQTEMSELAAMHVEAFRHDPLSVGVMLVQKRIKAFLNSFSECPLYLYVVDEFTCDPVLTETFPLQVFEAYRTNLLENCVLSMHLCALHARGVSKGVTGLLRLFYNDSSYSIPPSWTESGKNLNHKLDEVALVKEIQVLQEAVNDLFVVRQRFGDDHLQVVYDYLSEFDTARNFADVVRVLSGGACVWTTRQHAEQIESISNTLSFQDALKRNRRSESKLKEYRTRLDLMLDEKDS
jgi:serine/threonine protein kinase